MSDIEHVFSKNFVSVDVATEESAIAVRKIFGFVQSDVRELSNFGMQAIVLFIRVIQVSISVLVNSVFSEDVLEQLHSKEVRVGPFGGIKEDTDVQVMHFVVSHVDF